MVRCPECEQWVSVDVVGDVAMFSWHNSAAGDLHYSFCSASGQSVTRNALHAFGEAIATIARARLVARAMDGREVRASAGIAAFTAWRTGDEWQVIRWIRGDGEAVAYIRGRSEDTAAEVVDTLLRLVAEWEDAP